MIICKSKNSNVQLNLLVQSLYIYQEISWGREWAILSVQDFFFKFNQML